jgi:hypothetical protein
MRLGQACNYRDAPGAPSSASSEDFVELRHKVQELEGRLESKQAGNGTGVLSSNLPPNQFALNAFPAVFFLIPRYLKKVVSTIRTQRGVRAGERG